MDDVRLTPAERRALEEIEAELRKDRDLDRALRRMRVPKPARHLLRRRRAEPPTGAAAGDDAPGEHPYTPGEHRRVWLITFAMAVAFAAMLGVGSMYLVVFALVVITLAATAGVVWMCVTLYMRGPDPS